MFDIGFSELLVVFVVGLLILGPERLPHAAKTAGLWIRKIRRSINSVQREINAQLDQEELQQKISATNQRILEEEKTEEKVIQNTITPLPESDGQTAHEQEPVMKPIVDEKKVITGDEGDSALSETTKQNEDETGLEGQEPPSESKSSKAKPSESVE